MSWCLTCFCFSFLFFFLCVDNNVTDCINVTVNYWETLPQGNNCPTPVHTQQGEHYLFKITEEYFKILLMKAQRDRNVSKINKLWCRIFLSSLIPNSVKHMFLLYLYYYAVTVLCVHNYFHTLAQENVKFKRTPKMDICSTSRWSHAQGFVQVSDFKTKHFWNGVTSVYVSV